MRPGLIVTYRDAGETPLEITALEPILALALKGNEAPHPRLRPDGLTIRWEGQLKILRPAEYTFSAHVLGRFRFLLDGKEVLQIERGEKTAGAPPTAAIRLEAGDHPLVAEFTRLPGPARVQLFWQAKHIFAEPAPFDALGHLPSQEPKRLADDQLVEQGRFLAEEHSCTACHRPRDDDAVALGLQNRQGPDLSRVGERVKPEWFAVWLREPKQLAAHAIMPQLFPSGPVGEAELFAVASYLTSLGGPLTTTTERGNLNEVKASIARGERLFNTVGCVACHGTETKVYSLPQHLGTKSTITQLARFLQNPLETHPAGRMPSLLLNSQEATDLARYLARESVQLTPQPKPQRADADQAFVRIDPRADEQATFRKLPEERAWKTLGERLVLEKRCNACHKIEPGGKPFAQLQADADFDDLKNMAAQARGCLAEQPTDQLVPRFSLTTEQRRALRAFLSHGTRGRNTPAPAHAARVALDRFHCLGCHERDGQGGLTTDLTDQLRQFERAENAEAVSPPPLTGAGAKLTGAWLRKVLVEAGRARPWMGLRMPQFGAANVGHLAEALAACDGIDDSMPFEAQTANFDHVHTEADASAGRFLVGKKAFGCIGCHDIAGVPSSGTRGPDLAAMSQRVRYNWYRRWLIQPQKMQPGTRMPIVFNEGRTLLDEVLGGRADKQANAMWSYLSLGPTLPLPEGLEPPKGLVLMVKDRPVLLRTFLPDAGSKAIAVGYPGHVSIAYDAAQCRLAYAWSGNFLDAAPVWNDRGGSPAHILGTRFWEGPRGFPWFFERKIPHPIPHVGAQQKDPAYGAPLPEGKVWSGRMRLHPEGYRLAGADAQPVFRCRVEPPEGGEAYIEEQVAPLRSEAGVGVRRTFTLNWPSDLTPWLLLGETTGEPRVLDDKGRDMLFDRRIGGTSEARTVVLPGINSRPTVTLIEAAPPGSSVRLHREGESWKALLEVSDAPVQKPLTIRVSHWQPYRNEEPLVQQLLRAR